MSIVDFIAVMAIRVAGTPLEPSVAFRPCNIQGMAHPSSADGRRWRRGDDSL